MLDKAIKKLKEEVEAAKAHERDQLAEIGKFTLKRQRTREYIDSLEEAIKKLEGTEDDADI